MKSSPTQSIQTLFKRLTGVPILKQDPRYSQILSLVQQQKWAEAAHIITEDPRFYRLRVRNLAAQLTSRNESAFAPFNDAQALFIGVVRDNIDARELLSGNFRYQADPSYGLPQVSMLNNQHYEQIIKQDLDPTTTLTYSTPQWPEQGSHSAGILTTRAWAQAHYEGGTNRRAVQYTFQEFLCRPIAKWKYPNLPDIYVHRDVSRRPGENPSVYQTDCRTCHAGMDALAGAFAQMDFADGEYFVIPNKVANKMNQNGGVFPAGHVTIDDSWLNLSTEGYNQSIGWRGALSGKGVRDFGKMIANSRAFSECLVQNVYSHVCREKPDTPTQTELANRFEENGYNLRSLFEATAIHPTCLENTP